MYPGSIGTYGPYRTGSDGIRGICSDDNDLIYVAVETLNCVLVYDMNKDYKNVYNITWSKHADPIGVREGSPYYPNYLFVGDANNNSIIAFKVSNNGFEQLWVSQHTTDLDHPAGIAVGPDAIYVVSQNKNRILRFDPLKGTYLKTLVDFSNDKIVGENLVYVDGNGCVN